MPVFGDDGPDVTEISEKSLVEAAMDGEPESFRILCQRYYASMVAVAYSVLADSHLAEDAAQETFARACCNMRNLKRKDKFPSWLAGICRNVAKDMLRAQSTQFNTNDMSMVEEKPQNDCCINEAVWQAINKLSDSAREVVVLRYYNGLSYEKISGVLGISKGSINGRLTRAKRKIAKYLRHNGFPRE